LAEHNVQDGDGLGETASADLKELVDHWVQVIDRWVQHIDQGMGGGLAEGADPAVMPGLAPEAELDRPVLEAG
jgi:hypothetical protein